MRASEIDAARRTQRRHRTISRWAWLGVPLGMGAALSLVELGQITPPTWLLYTLIAAIPGAAVVDNILQASRERSIGAQKDSEIDMLKACVALAADVSVETGVDVQVIGVSVWRVYTPKTRPRAGVQQACLRRLTRFRILGHPAPSDASWTEGKGVIGRCWEKGQPCYQDWGRAQRKHPASSTMSETKWTDLSPDRRWGFERGEYIAAVHKYAQVLAVPITDEHGKFVGCLSVDIPTAVTDLVPTYTEGVLDNGKVRKAMAQTVESVRRAFT